VSADFESVFAGIGVGAAKESDNDLINPFAVQPKPLSHESLAMIK
jgi:hypothetical protein